MTDPRIDSLDRRIHAAMGRHGLTDRDFRIRRGLRKMNAAVGRMRDAFTFPTESYREAVTALSKFAVTVNDRSA